MIPSIGLALAILFQARRPLLPAPTSDSLWTQVQQSEVRLARVETRAEDMKSQLELEKISADREIETLLFLLKFGSVSMTIILGAFGFIGYRNLKKSIADQVDDALEEALAKSISSMVEPRLQMTLDEWDKKFAKLMIRIEGLGSESQ
jgi:hypothetical protein